MSILACPAPGATRDICHAAARRILRRMLARAAGYSPIDEHGHRRAFSAVATKRRAGR